MVVRAILILASMGCLAGCADGGTVAPYGCTDGDTMPCRKGAAAVINDQYVCVNGEWMSMCAEDTQVNGGSGG